MLTKLDAKQRAAFLASPTQAVAARIVQQDGKAFRNVSRDVFGIFVQGSNTHAQNGAWDDRTRAFRLAHIEASGNAPLRAAIVAAYKDGADTPPTSVPTDK